MIATQTGVSLGHDTPFSFKSVTLVGTDERTVESLSQFDSTLLSHHKLPESFSFCLAANLSDAAFI